MRTEHHGIIVTIPVSQVTNGIHRFSDDTPLAGQQFSYAYDTIGNRTESARNGQPSSYTPNSLNQYTQRTHPGLLVVDALAPVTANVTVDGESATRQGDHFFAELSVENESGAVYEEIEVIAIDGMNSRSETGHLFLAQTPENFLYDEDGNLTQDGRWRYTWNGENRLIQIETLATLPTNVPRVRLELVYDYQGRRSVKRVLRWSGSAWEINKTIHFVYDAWTLIEEHITDHLTSTVSTNQYVWGSDLSESFQGAGGIGGLLAIDSGSAIYYTTYDGSGNLATLMNSADGTVVATYEYDPFGNTLQSTGPYADTNPFRFSTKYTDDETGLVYYGYRYYSPDMGRWLNRDPLEESGGINLYLSFYNNAMFYVDPDGLAPLAGSDQYNNPVRVG